ncbi:hypothetical protein OROHE_004553 [Orobanche hederae]
MLLMIQDVVSKGDDEVFAETSTGATAFQLLCGHEHDILLVINFDGHKIRRLVHAMFCLMIWSVVFFSLVDSELDMNVMMDRSILGRNMGLNGEMLANELVGLLVSLKVTAYCGFIQCVTKVVKSAFNKALVEHENIDDVVGSEEPTEREQGVDRQQPLLIKIDSPDSHQK